MRLWGQINLHQALAGAALAAVSAVGGGVWERYKANEDSRRRLDYAVELGEANKRAQEATRQEVAEFKVIVTGKMERMENATARSADVMERLERWTRKR